MALVTFQVINGFEKGHVFQNLATPVTIGREDDNSIRLNDERVSRFHAKVQEDSGRFILTDLDSTNGTRVNGHPVQMRILQFGDQVSVGRSLLVFGSDQQLSEKYAGRRRQRGDSLGLEDHTVAIPALSADSSGNLQLPVDAPVEHSGLNDVEIEVLFPNGPPEVPQELRPVQAAQVSDMLSYVHDQIATILETAEEQEREDGFGVMQIDWRTWHRLLKLEMSLAEYLRKLVEPEA